MIQFLKTHGVKVSLPLLLLATACDEGTPSASQADTAAPVAAEALVVAAQPSSGFGTPSVDSAELNAPEVAINLDADAPSIADVLPPGASTEEGTSDAAMTSEAISAANEPTKIPEPTALAGLAIAAAGLRVVKRKQAM